MKYPLIFAIALLFRPLFFITTYFLGFQISEESIGFTIASIVLDLAIVVMFIKYISRSKIGKHTFFGLFFVVLMLVLAILSYLRLQLHAFTLNYFIKYFLSLSIPFFALGIMIDLSNKSFSFLFEEYLTILSIFIIFSFLYITLTSITEVQQLTGVNTLNYQSIGYYLTFSGLIVFLFSFDRQKPFLFVKLLAYILSFFLVIFTGARGPLIAFFLGTVAIAFFKSRRVFISILIIAIVFILLLNPIIDVLYNYFPSFSHGVIRGLSFLYFGRNQEYPLSGQIATREHLYRKALDLLGDYPVFGTGIGGFSYHSGIMSYPHNIVLEILAEYGVFGLTMFFILFSYLYSKVRKHIKKSIGLLLVIFVFSITQLLFSGSFLCSTELWFCAGALFSYLDKAKVVKSKGRTLLMENVNFFPIRKQN